TEDHRCDHCDCQGKRQNMYVYRSGDVEWDLCRKMHRCQRSGKPIGEEQAQSCARKRKQQTFRQQLSDYISSPCADGQANSSFPTAPCRASKDKAGQIRACDHENQACESQQCAKETHRSVVQETTCESWSAKRQM